MYCHVVQVKPIKKKLKRILITYVKDPKNSRSFKDKLIVRDLEVP